MSKKETVQEIKDLADKIKYEHVLIDKWIAMLLEAGYDYDGMIKVFRLAGEKYKKLLKL